MRIHVNFSNSYLGLIWCFGLLLLALAGCGPAEVDTASPPQSNPLTTEGYPPPPTVQQDLGAAYPAQTAASQQGTLLALDKPVQPGDTVISGVGPAGLTVFVLNITFMGEEVGSGIIGESGVFTISVTPLPAGVRLGLAADVASIGLTDEEVRPGDGEISIPSVGYFYDSVVVLQQN